MLHPTEALGPIGGLGIHVFEQVFGASSTSTLTTVLEQGAAIAGKTINDGIQSAQETRDAIVEQVTHAGEVLLGDEGSPKDVGPTSQSERPQPEQIEAKVDEVITQDPPLDTYKSQRDNESSHGSADVLCSPTSFTMALIDIHGGDEASVQAQAKDLLHAVKGKTDYTQTEDLLIELLQKTNWEAAEKAKPSFFWRPPNKTWAQWAKSTYGGRYYKDPNAQQYIASLFSCVANSKAVTHNCERRADWAPVIEALSKGAKVYGEGAFTSSGHVVYVTAADDTGIHINDPYGCWIGSYIKNGNPAPKLNNSALRKFETRSKDNPLLNTMMESRQPYARWGENNYYTWSEVEALQIGKWLSVLI